MAKFRQILSHWRQPQIDRSLLPFQKKRNFISSINGARFPLEPNFNVVVTTDAAVVIVAAAAAVVLVVVTAVSILVVVADVVVLVFVSHLVVIVAAVLVVVATVRVIASARTKFQCCCSSCFCY